MSVRDLLCSPHFALSEMCVSASAPHLVTPPAQVPPEVVGRLRTLCATVLEPLRADLSRPIRVLSGYRSPALNRAVGGSPTSQHTRGEAADVQVFGLAAVDLFRRLIGRAPLLPTGQVIVYPSRGFVHLALPGRTYSSPSFHVHEPAHDFEYKRVLSERHFERLLAEIGDAA